MDEVTRSEYLLFVFMAAVGVLQLVGARTQLKGLLFFKKPALAYLISLLALGGSFYWFFVRDDRMDTIMRHTGLEGAQQFYYFCLAAFAGLVFTLLVSSLINTLRPKGHSMESSPVEGLEALNNMSYLEALRRSLRGKRRG